VKDENMTKEHFIDELAKLGQENIELKLTPKDQERISIVSEWSSPSCCFSTVRSELFVSNLQNEGGAQ